MRVQRKDYMHYADSHAQSHQQSAQSAKLGTINHIRFTVSDVARAEQFYTPLLSFLGYGLYEKSDVRVAWMAREENGKKRLFIVSASSPDAANIKHDRYSPGLHHLGFNVDGREQVDEFYRLLKKSDAEVLDPPAEYNYEPGYYAVFFTDPDGIKLEVVHIPVSAPDFRSLFILQSCQFDCGLQIDRSCHR